jgi:hypothetical protein
MNDTGGATATAADDFNPDNHAWRRHRHTTPVHAPIGHRPVAADLPHNPTACR